MNRSSNLQLLMGIASALAFAAGANAQDAPPPEPDRGVVEEITVTATRRAETQQDVPISISAYSAADLEKSRIETVQDLGLQTPGLTIANQSAAMTPFIRGVGAVDNTVGQEAAVSTYVDGVYYPSVYGALFSFNNIERVEVLKGPQGTLFGRNATGGLIHVITRDPSSDPEMSASVSYGSFDTVGAKFYGTAGLGDSLAADIAVVYRDQSEGFGRNRTTGREIGFLGDELGIRSKFLFTPGDATDITLSLDYVDSEGDIGSAKNLLPGSISTVDGLPQTAGFYNVRGGMHEFVDTEQWGASLNIRHEFSAVDFVSITSYRDTTVVQNFDNDVTPVVHTDAYIDNQVTKTITQEFQVLSKPGSNVSWIGGLFYLNDESGFQGPLGLGLYGLAVGGTGVQIKNTIDTESYSAFGEATFPLGEKTDLTLGARWTQDKREISGRTDVVDSNSPPGNLLLSIPSPSSSFDEGEPTWRLVLTREVADDFMVYGSYNRGYKSGNYNTVSAADAPFDSEIVDAYEIGMKSQLLENRLRLNSAVFFYDYKNLQLSVLTGSFLTTQNAADSEIKGIEVDGEFVATDSLRFRFGASFLDTEYTSFPSAQCSSRQPDGITVQFSCDASGNSLTRSPSKTFNVGAFYNIPTDTAGDFDLSATYAYNGGFYWEPDNRLTEDSFALFNAELRWTSQDGRFGASVFGKNLLDEEYSVWNAAFALGDVYAAAPPRTYGVEFSVKL